MMAALGLTLAMSLAEEKVPWMLHVPGYFESNKSGLSGAASHLVFTDEKSFHQVFRSVFVPGGKAKLLSRDAFDKQVVIATIKRGKEVFTYTVEKVTLADGVLELTYRAKGKDGGGSAMFASPLIIAVPKRKYRSVVFVENGKKVATVKLGR
jgi:hypothetical protein